MRKLFFIYSFLILGVLSTAPFASAKSDTLSKDSLQWYRWHTPAGTKTFSFNKVLRESRGWVSPKGQGFFKLGQAFMRSNRFFAPDGEEIDITTTSLYITSLYGEYGLSDRWTIKAYLPLFMRVTLNEVQFEPSGNTIPGDEFNSIADIDVGVTYGLIQNKPFVLSVGLTLGLPTGDTGGGDTQLLQTGDGEFNQLIQLQAGYAIPNSRAYLGASVGFNNRTNDFSDEFRYGLEAGYSFTPSWTAIVKMDGIQSFENGDALGTMNGIFSNNTEYLIVSPELIYTLKERYGVLANASFPLSGQNILAEPSYSFGIFWKLK